MYEFYNTFTTDGLYNAALTHLFQISAANDPKGVKRGPVLPLSSASCVEASRLGVSMNFASRIVQGLVASDLSKVDGLLDEAWRRMEKTDLYPMREVNTYVELGRQARLFLDNLRGTAALNTDDLRNMGEDNCRALCL